MRKIFIAVVAVGICFGVTSVKAGMPYTCEKLREWAFKELDLYKMNKAMLVGITEEALKSNTLAQKADLIRTNQKMVKDLVEEAASLATIYTAFCKK